MRTITDIVVHCSANREGQDFNAADIRAWHTDPPPRGRGWSDIGYHAVVLLDGMEEPGRPVERSGAHAQGCNESSLGVVYVGGLELDGQTPKDTRTPAQRETLLDICARWCEEYSIPVDRVRGHNELPGVSKACPCFDMGVFRSGLMGTMHLQKVRRPAKVAEFDVRADHLTHFRSLPVDLPTLWPSPWGTFEPSLATTILAMGLDADPDKAAVMDFQRAANLTPDGVVGQKTWPLILAAL